MPQKYEIDSLDKKIISYLQKDARHSFLDISRKLSVSSGTIHQRYEKLKEANIITGSSIKINYENLGYDVTTLLGLHLKKASDVSVVLEKLNKLKEVTEANYTTGSFALIIKIKTKDISHLHKFLLNDLQKIEEIQSTESFVILNTPIQKELSLK